jgi:nucleoside-diphosphate-sugar epimerase
MRIVVFGATGNIGTSLLAELAARPEVDEIVGVARRAPSVAAPRTRWVAADITTADLAPVLAGADAVANLVWAIQPSRDLDVLHRINVVGSRRVFEAAAAAGVPALLHTSSIGAYSAGPKDPPVGEDWPTDGIDSSFYSRHKAYAERILDGVEQANPGLRVIRIRPAIVGKGPSSTHLRQLFLGPLLPNALVGRLPAGPAVQGLRIQVVHADDVARAMALALLGDARGAFNLAADPVLEPEDLARGLGGIPVPVPAAVARAAAAVSWRLRLQPSPPGWVDLALGTPLIDSSRARRELGWMPAHDARSVLAEVLAGLRQGADGATPPLSSASSGPARSSEFATGVGARP